jgi:copper homeostasis protein (lipoprotein)
MARIFPAMALLLSPLLLLGCGSAPEPEPERPAFPATYTGTLPCADCPGIDYTLELQADGTFIRRADYRGQSRQDEVGRWLLSAHGDILVLRGSRGETERFQRRDRETLLRLDGRPAAQSKQVLKRREDLPPMQPRLTLRGRYSPDTPFLACSSGRSLPVVPDLGAAQLESAWLQQSGVPGEPALVEVEARIGQHPDASGLLQPSLEVLRFVQLLPDAPCPVPFVALPLRGTDWTVTQLGGVPVFDEENARAPSLRFEAAESRVNGFTGCNRLLGQYAVNGGSLTFDKLAATRMACPGASLLELTFTDALKATASWNVFGDELELYDDEGLLLIRLQGRAP